MTDRQTPKAKLTNDQYTAFLRKISKIHAVLDDMTYIMAEIQIDRQSKHDDSDGELFADCDDLDKIWDAIEFGHKKINEMKEMIWEVVE